MSTSRLIYTLFGAREGEETGYTSEKRKNKDDKGVTACISMCIYERVRDKRRRNEESVKEEDRSLSRCIKVPRGAFWDTPDTKP